MRSGRGSTTKGRSFRGCSLWGWARWPMQARLRRREDSVTRQRVLEGSHLGSADIRVRQLFVGVPFAREVSSMLFCTCTSAGSQRICSRHSSSSPQRLSQNPATKRARRDDVRRMIWSDLIAADLVASGSSSCGPAIVDCCPLWAPCSLH